MENRMNKTKSIAMAIIMATFLSVHANTPISGDKAYSLSVPLDTSYVFDIDEVVVISQPKDSYKLKLQQISSSILSANDITNFGIRDIRDLSSIVPSFVMPSYGSRLTSAMYIRGIGSRINSPAIGIYLDGMPLINKNAFNFYTYQIDRIDVLRGPQGTLYGQNTEGGLIRLYSKNPLTYKGTDIKISSGSHFLRNIEIAHYNKINDKIGYNINGFYNGSNGFLRNRTTNDRADKINEGGGKLRFIYKPTDRLTLDWFSDYQYVRQNGFAYGRLDLSSGKVESPSSNYQSNYTRHISNSGFGIHLNTDKLDISSTTTYQYLKDFMLMDQDYMPQDYMHFSQRQLQNALTEEFVIKNKDNETWRWTSGIFGMYQWLKTTAPVYFGKDMTGPISNNIQRTMYNSIIETMAKKMIAAGMPETVARSRAKAIVDQNGGVSVGIDMKVPGTFRTPSANFGIFHESNINIADRIMITAGVRYDYNRTKISYDTYAQLMANANVMGQSAMRNLTSILKHNEHDNFGEILPKLGLTYKINEESNVYAVISKGYRAGGYNIQMFSDILQSEIMTNRNSLVNGDLNITHDKDDYEKIKNTISYKPERSWNYEIGAHITAFDRKININMSAFYMNVYDQQLSVMAGTYGFGRMMVNAGKSRSIGFETSLTGTALNNHLTWGINYATTDAVFREYTDKESIGGETQTIDYRNKKVPFVPRYTLGTNISYLIDIRNNALKHLKFGINTISQGRTYWDEANSFNQSAYTVLNSRIEADLGIINLSIWGRNITNTRYNTFAIKSSATGQTLYFGQRAMPIQWGFDMKIHL